MVASAKTVVSAKPPVMPPVGPPPGKVIAERPSVPQVGQLVQQAAATRRKNGLWIGLGAGGLFLIVAVVIGLMFFRNKNPFLAAPVPTPTRAFVQASPTLPVVFPTATTETVSLPVASDTPVETPAPTEPAAPSPTPTVPGLPSIGGADKIAFLSNKDIWLLNVDGTELSQLTQDGGDKHDLQWSPGGESLFYISGKCVQNVTVPEGAVSTVTCFPTSEFVEAFEISPDGSQVAISVNHVLFIVPLDLAALAGANRVGQLAFLPGGIFAYPDLNKQQSIKQVRWLKSGKRIAVDSLTPNNSGQIVDSILIYDISSCTSATPCDSTTYFMTTYKDIFPGARFSMSGYGVGGGKNSRIPSFDWNEDGIFLLNSIVRNSVYGYLYIYESSNQKGQQIDPLGSQCCYTDAIWSPDGKYVLFAYQDIRQGNASKTELYYLPYGSIGTGARITPLPLPNTILSAAVDHPDAALRPTQ